MPQGALEGLRVLDLTWIVAGPTCTRILADFGAEVIRVEYQQTLDYARFIPPVEEPGNPNASGFFNNLNRNKLSITLNAVHPEGAQLLRRLLSISDVLVENFSAGVLERWGLSYEAIRRIRPDIVYVSISGFGHSGRCRDYVTWGPTAQALSGLTFMSGLPDLPPAGWGFSYMDLMAGHTAAIACLMALHHRHRTGRGQWIDISQVEAGIVLTGPYLLDYVVNGRPYRRPGNPPGNASTFPAVAPHNTYPCQGEDRWCVISVFDEEEWRGLVRAMGEPDWAHDPAFATNEARVQHRRQLDQHIARWTATMTPHQVMELLQCHGVPAGAVQTPRDLVDHDPQLRARGFYPEAEHPLLGRRRFEGQPVHLSRTPWALRRAAPLLGQDNDYVYRRLLGLGEAELARLAEEGVI